MRNIPSSKLGENILFFKAVVCLETTFKLSPLSKISSVTNSLLFKDVVCLGTSPSLDPLSQISSVPNGARASVICFHSVVVITFASHAKGPQFETGWKQSLVV